MRVVRYYPRALVGDGGMTGAVRKWSEGFVRAGAEAVIAYDEGVAPRPDTGGVEWRPVRHRGRDTLRAPAGFERVLRGADVLVLHSGWVLHNVRAAAVARRLGIPYVLEPRGAYNPHIFRRKAPVKRVWWAALERKLVSRARAIHVFFEEERADLEAIGYHGDVVIASNGVDAPPESAWEGGGGYVLWLGRFDPEHKGLDLLLRGVAMMPPEARPGLLLHGPEWRRKKGEVHAIVASFGLQGNVTIGDAVYGDAKRKLLVRADGFVYPSRWDACPNSVLESVSLGVPTLVTPYPLGRYLADRHGALLSSLDPAELGAGLVRLRSPEAVEVGSAGARVVREELAWDVVARSWLRQVEALL